MCYAVSRAFYKRAFIEGNFAQVKSNCKLELAYFLLSMECKIKAPIVAIEKIMPKYPSRLSNAPIMIPT